ncbi:MAG: hypothetical protein AAF629_13390, partial [Chloroflexota bacterium]
MNIRYVYTIVSLMSVLYFLQIAPSKLFALQMTDQRIIYDDILQEGFQDWSWATVDQTVSTPVYQGARSIAVTYTDGFQGAWFIKGSGAAFSAGQYTALQFAIHGGTTGGQQISIKIGPQVGIDSGDKFPTNSVLLTNYLPGEPVANAWRTVTIPLSDLNLQNSPIGNIAFQSELGTPQATFYLDQIMLIGTSDQTDSQLIGNVHIDDQNIGYAINPHILGSNLPAWLNPTRLADETFRARTIASGVSILRMP